MEPTYTGRIKRFSLLEIRKRRLKERLERVEAELDALSEVLKEDFSELGQSSARIGGYTHYLHRQWWAGAVKGADGEGDYATSCAALDEAGLGDMVQPRFNVMTLSAWVRELPRDQDGLGAPILPPELVGKISVVEKTDIRTRKSGKAK